MSRRNRWLEHFIMMNCAPDLLALKLFPNVKEITETMSMVWHTKEIVKQKGFQWNDPNIKVYVLGDGCVPRTGATFAYSTAWTVFSIDPALQKHVGTHWGNRIVAYPCKAEDFDPMDKPMTLTIISSVHGHVNTMAFAERVVGPKLVIEMPCCMPLSLKQGNFLTDRDVLSPKNILYWEWMDISPIAERA